MNILEQITAYKKVFVADCKARKSVRDLEKELHFKRVCFSLKDKLNTEDASGIIAEYKRQSPSKGIINATAKVEEVVRGYADADVSGISVLTDEHFFGGSAADFIIARNSVDIPLLRKEFMIDEYQFVEAKAMGADIILLIASILSPQQVKIFTDLAQNLGMQVLLELHNETELNHVYHKVDMVGINNRNLKTFEVDIEQSVLMSEYLGSDFVKVAESGISDVTALRYFRQHGFKGFLIGENFMKQANPGIACSEFVKSI